MDRILFAINDYEFTVNQGISILILIVLLFALHRIRLLLLGRLFHGDVDEKKPNRASNIILFMIFLIGLVHILGINFELAETEQFVLRLNSVFYVLIVFQVARILDWVLAGDLLPRFYEGREMERSRKTKRTGEERGSRVVRYIIYLLAILVLLSALDINFTLFSVPQESGEIHFRISQIFSSLLIFLFAWLLIWVMTQIVFYNYFRHSRIDPDRQYALNKLFSYIIYVVAAILVLESLEIKMTVIWGGAAALLVGIGLGLQEVFRDLVSGIILLFERTIRIGDVIQVNEKVGTIQRIGLRTSELLGLDNIVMLIPNSLLTSDRVTNWSHAQHTARFWVTVGVAYGSDTTLVSKLLIDACKADRRILEQPIPFIRFVDFGNSSLVFEVHFWTRSLILIEDIKSDLRLAIDQLFRQNGVTIPFPQRDVHMK